MAPLVFKGGEKLLRDAPSARSYDRFRALPVEGRLECSGEQHQARTWAFTAM